MTDAQLSITRSIFEAQAKIAAQFGAPDLSSLYASNDHAHSFEKGIGQAVELRQRAIGEMQDHWIGFVRQHAKEFVNQLQEDIEGTGRETKKGASEATESGKQALPSGGEPRQIERIGSPKARGGDQKDQALEKPQDASRQASPPKP
jgi:hypothetical protein